MHRMLREWLQKGFKGKRREKLEKELPEIALHSSQRERAAAEAERETVQLKLVEYMERFIGEEFAGVISSVTAFGFFVELDNGVEGLVHISTLDDDYYQFIEERYCLLGERTRRLFQLGQSVTIRVARVNSLERTIDFQLVAGGEKQPKGVGDEKRTRPAAAKKQNAVHKPKRQAGKEPAAGTRGKPADRVKSKRRKKQ